MANSNALFGTDTDDVDALERSLRLVNAVADGIYQLDADGHFVAVNDAIVELTGYSRDALIGAHVSTVVDDADVRRLDRAIRERPEPSVSDPAAFELAIETADGGRRRCEIRLTFLEADGEFDGVAGVASPIDEPPRRQEPDHLPSAWELDDSITSVLNEADVGVFVLDETFDVVWINETTEEYFGIDRSQVAGRDKRTLIDEQISERFTDPETFAETVLATYDDNTYVECFECEITAGEDRERRWLEHRSRPIESGQYAGGRIELYYDVTDRKASEQAKRESERRFRSLVDAVEEYAIFMLDRDGRVVSWNEGAEQIKGYDEDEVLGEHISVFYTDDARADGIPERILEEARASGTAEDEGWRVRADGSQFWANVTITAIREDGELKGYAKVTHDTTDRREREQQLRRERDLVERILETSPVGIAVVNADGSTSRANERLADLLGVPPDGISSYERGDRDMFDADGTLVPVEERPASRAFETGQPQYDRELLVYPPERRRRWLSITATPITGSEAADEPEQVVVTATDITDLKELAQRRKRDLEEREKELAAVQLATNLLDTDEQSVDELLEEFVTDLPQFFQQPDETAVRVAVGDTATTTDAYEPCDRSITARVKTANGTPISIDAARTDESPQSDASPFLAEESELLDTLATLLKFHVDRREYIDELQASNERLQQFAYAASHDLQEPLRMVSTYLQLIENRYADALDDDGEEFLEFAIDGAERMRTMIDRLLAYSRIETRGEPLEPTDLDAVLDDVRTDLQFTIDEQNAEITSESLPTVAGDASQLRQLVQNLLENAIEYSGDERPRVHVGAERTGENWTVSVADNGVGIDPDDHDRIFEVFQRLHASEDNGGTGIGLALCERIVERHGGEIWVDSEPGEGTTFSFTLPDAQDA